MALDAESRQRPNHRRIVTGLSAQVGLREEHSPSREGTGVRMREWHIKPTTGSDGAYERGLIAKQAKQIDRLVRVLNQRADLTAKLLSGRTLPY